MLIRFKNGSTWQVVGSDNYDRLVGTPPAGIVFSEWALAEPAAWAYFAPDPRRKRRLGAVHHHPARAQPCRKRCSTWRRETRTGSPRSQTVEDTGALSREPSRSSAANITRCSAKRPAMR